MAMQAVRDWLTLMDRGEYAASWEAASDWFHGVISKEKWASTVESVRVPLGELLVREVFDTRFTAGGSRFQARFKSGFAGMAETVETLSFMRQRDGAWKATGYLIRPADYEETRYTRLATAGACLAALFPISLFLIYLVRSQVSNGPISVLPVLLIAPFALVGILAPVLTTLLGWVATVHLRRSSGERQGLWLAVFDGLLFPLLALDVAIGAFWFALAGLLVAWIDSQSWHPLDARALDHVFLAAWVLVTVVTTALAD
jgi:hypothetical protein